MSKLHTVIEALRQNGARGLSEAIRQNARTDIYQSIHDMYINLHDGTKTITVAGIPGTYYGDSDHGGPIFEHRLRSEEWILKRLLNDFQPDDIFYDVGANIGNYTIYAANKLRNGAVVAFEPFPPNVDQLNKNLSQNPSPADLHVLEIALADNNGTAPFTAPESNEVGLGTAMMKPGDRYGVEVARADDLIVSKNLPEPTIVKIDVEGAEALVIDGMKGTLASPRCRALYCEVHLPWERRASVPDYQSSVGHVLETVQQLGFAISEIKKRGNETHIIAEK